MRRHWKVQIKVESEIEINNIRTVSFLKMKAEDFFDSRKLLQVPRKL